MEGGWDALVAEPLVDQVDGDRRGEVHSVGARRVVAGEALRVAPRREVDQRHVSGERCGCFPLEGVKGGGAGSAAVSRIPSQLSSVAGYSTHATCGAPWSSSEWLNSMKRASARSP